MSCGLRVVLARETDGGLETIAGESRRRNVEALEVLVTAFDEVTATRQLDRSGVWLLDASEGAPRPAAPAPAPAPTPQEMRSAVSARSAAEQPRSRPS